MNDETMEEALPTIMDPRQCFSVVQSRRFHSPIAESTMALCPSMDLFTFGLLSPSSSSSSSHPVKPSKLQASPPLWLHRSLSFQKLATVVLTNDEPNNQAEEEEDKDDNLDNEDKKPSSTIETTTTAKDTTHTVVWRPDGRWLALADPQGGHLTLYHTEALVREVNLTGSHIFSSSVANTSLFPQTSDYQVAMAGNAVRMPLTDQAVCGMVWKHAGQWHPLLTESSDDDDDDDEDSTQVAQLYSKIRQRYAGSSSRLLPASEYHSEYHQCDHHTSSQTPLSLLVVALQDGKLEGYVNGRYRILSDVSYGDKNNTMIPTRAQIACSNDLSHILVAAHGPVQPIQSTQPSPPPLYSVFAIPALAEQRYTLQSISSLYSSIMGHFYNLPNLLTEVLESYKSSLKPLDMKIDTLARLLRNYGLLPTTPSPNPVVTAKAIRQHLVRYILSGHTAGSADLSNAMDQFFTGVQMNDQLIQRMERTLTVAVANVESMLRKTIAAAQALVLETDELRGLARSSNELIPSQPSMELQEHCQALLLAMESALTSLVDTRFRLRDWIAWLRATGSQIKARGTAANSVQRDNAKKRRVPDDAVRRILQYLQEEKTSQEPSSNASGSMSEYLLGVHLSHHWAFPAATEKAERERPTSPKSVAAAGPLSQFLITPSIPFAFQKALATSKRLFDLPSRALKDCIRRFDMESSQPLPTSTVKAITTRLGAGGLNGDDLAYGESAPSGFFCPTTLDGEGTARTYRQWAVSAQAIEPNKVQLCALPLSWHTISTSHQWNNQDRNNNEDEKTFEKYWETNVLFPRYCTVHQVEFYGDDGKSGLFAGRDNGTGKERRQTLAALVSKENPKTQGESSFVLELWLIPYDRAVWRQGRLVETIGGKCTKISFDPIQEPCCAELVAAVGDVEEEEEEEETTMEESKTLNCKTRKIGIFASTEDAAAASFVLSGSRGMAAVSTKSASGSFLQVLDMEEDEEVEDEEMEEG